MNLGRISLMVLVSAFLIATSLIADTEEEKDFAVPAFSDLPFLGTQNATTQAPTSNANLEQLNLLPDIAQLRWCDINRDLQLNEFDVKEFQSIIESLNGEKLTGLQLSIQFQAAQKNQRESFPLLYDLDRDGMFTPYDVDYFTQVVTNLDEGATRGNELVQKFKLQLFPMRPSETRSTK